MGPNYLENSRLVRVPGRKREVKKMKRPTLQFIDKFFTARFLAVAISVVVMSMAVSAQKIALATYDLDQCRNSLITSPVQCADLGGNLGWVNGNAGASNAHWAESQFVPFRARLGGLTLGTHTMVISWDSLTSDMAAHTMDYIGTYNYTETDADPCSGVAGCTLASGLTFPVPFDTETVTNQINPNTGGFIQQIPGVLTIWGGEITSAVYTAPDHPHERHLTVTFTAAVDNPVIAWAGHIAWIGDWGAGQSASTVTGSSYHMRIDALDGIGGNTDRGLLSAAVTPSGVVIIVKEVFTLDLTNKSTFSFPFTSTLNFGKTNFSLVDNNILGPDREVSQPITSLGPTNTINVTEGTVMGFGWTVSDIACSEIAPANSTTNLATRTASIVVDANEAVVCTFRNTQYRTTAAPVNISGTVVEKGGAVISGARLSLTNMSRGETRSAISNQFGNFVFTDLPSGDTYTLTIRHKSYQFLNNLRTFTLFADLADMNFYGQSLELER